MEKLSILALLLIPFLGCSQKSNSTSSNPVSDISKTGLIFQTGFEPDTKIIKQNDKSARVVGIDRSFNELNNWDNDLGAHKNIGYFNVQYQGGDKTQRLAEIVPDPKDSSNNVIKFWLKEPNVNPKKGRVQCNVYNNNNIREVDYSIRLFIPSDFNVVKSAPFDVKWLTLMEFWNNANWKGEDYQFRISVNLQKRGIGTDSLRIAIKAQTKNTETGKWRKPYLWEVRNENFIVPIEKWMTLDIHFLEGDEKNGEFRFSVTPEGEPTTVVHDVINYTHHPDDPNPDGIAHLNPFKLYTSDDLIEYVTGSGKMLHLYWDDFKFSIETKKK